MDVQHASVPLRDKRRREQAHETGKTNQFDARLLQYVPHGGVELAAARAISVVRFLAGKGIPPEHLVAAGYGEFQPLEDADTEEAMAKNRRIELKLTER